MTNFKRTKWLLKYNGKEIFVPEWVEHQIGLILLCYKPEDEQIGTWARDHILAMEMHGYPASTTIEFIAGRLYDQDYECDFGNRVDHAGYYLRIKKAAPRLIHHWGEYRYTAPTSGTFTVSGVNTTTSTITLSSDTNWTTRVVNTVRSWMS